MVQKLLRAYRVWQDFLRHFPKTSRYTLGGRIDGLFLDTVESVLSASYLPREQKLPAVRRAATKLDVLKFFLQVAWDIKALDTKKYIALSEAIAEAGKMLGGWIKQLQRETPA